MYYPVGLPALIPVIILITACGGKGVGIAVSEYETDTMTAHIELPIFQCITDDDFRERLESEYADYAAELLAEIENEEGMKNVSVVQDVTYTGKNIVSLYTDTSVEYSNKPVGMLNRMSAVIDTENNREMELSELFIREDYEGYLLARMREQLQKDPDRYSGLWAMPDLENPQDFYLTDDSIVFFYQPYKLSYYNKGIVEVEVPYSELRGYITYARE